MKCSSLMHNEVPNIDYTAVTERSKYLNRGGISVLQLEIPVLPMYRIGV